MRCYAYNDIEKRTTGVFVNTTYFVSVHIEDGKKRKRDRDREREKIKKTERGRNVLRAVNKRRPVATLFTVLILIKRAPEKYYRSLITSAVRTEAKNDGQ